MTRTVITNADVIDGLGNAVRRNCTIVVEGDRIAEVREGDGRVTSDGDGPQARHIPGAGKTVMPGLIDAHCHMTYGESLTQEEQDIYTSVEGRTLRTAWNVQKVLAAGVTGISQPGGSYYIGVAVRDGIRAGRIKGPRMTTAGRYITTSNGLVDFYPHSGGAATGAGSVASELGGGIGIRCDSLEAMIVEVRRQVHNGVDFIKLADSAYGGFKSFRDEELREIADLAHQLGKRVTIHARGDAEMRAAALAGFDWVMHGNVMTRETVDILAEKQIPLVPTLVLIDNWARHGELIGTPSTISEACKRMLERTRDSLHMAREAGVRFVTGTDSGFAMTPYGEWHARELELLVEYAGLTTLEAIQAATSNAALTLNLEGQVGAVAPGMLADLLVVDGDPSQDLSLLQDPARIETILLGGEVVDIDADIESWPNEPSRTFAVRNLTREMVQEVAASRGTGAEERTPVAPPSTTTGPEA